MKRTLPQDASRYTEPFLVTLMNSPAPEDASVLIHDLRQPISNIGLCVSYLQLLLESGAEVQRVQEQLKAIQDQVDRAALLLDNASAALRNRGDQPSLDLTKPESASVA